MSIVHPQFIAGLKHATLLVGTEGDHRGADWSEPYNLLQQAVEDHEKLARDFSEWDRVIEGLQKAGVPVIRAPRPVT